MVKNVVSHTNNHLSKILGGAWGGTDLRPIWALPGCILKGDLSRIVNSGDFYDIELGGTQRLFGLYRHIFRHLR